MKTTAIICEFNPLHTGHKRLIDYAKSFSNKVICIMSGNFTQRGLPACADKYSRAKHAILAGCDLVVELPTVFATASAQNFAYGGVAIAKLLNVDYLLFGSECGNITELTHLVDMLETEETNAKIRSALQRGITYPKAVATATSSSLLDSPNNVLAIEYLNALRRLKCDITPVTIARENNYNLQISAEYASSTALRADKKLRQQYTYDFVRQDIDDKIEDKFGAFATLALSLMSKEQWASIEGISEGIENRFITADKSNGYNYLLEQVKNKRFTRAKLQRIVLNAVLNITSADVEKSKKQTININPLAVGSNSVELLQFTDKNCDIITQRADKLYEALSGKKPPVKLLKI